MFEEAQDYFEFWQDLKRSWENLQRLDRLGIADSEEAKALQSSFDQALPLALESFPSCCDGLDQAYLSGEISSVELDTALAELQANALKWLSVKDQLRLFDLYALLLGQDAAYASQARAAAWALFEQAAEGHPAGRSGLIEALNLHCQELRAAEDPLSQTLRDLVSRFRSYDRPALVVPVPQERNLWGRLRKAPTRYWALILLLFAGAFCVGCLLTLNHVVRRVDESPMQPPPASLSPPSLPSAISSSPTTPTADLVLLPSPFVTPSRRPSLTVTLAPTGNSGQTSVCLPVLLKGVTRGDDRLALYAEPRLAGSVITWLPPHLPLWVPTKDGQPIQEQGLLLVFVPGIVPKTCLAPEERGDSQGFVRATLSRRSVPLRIAGRTLWLYPKTAQLSIRILKEEPRELYVFVKGWIVSEQVVMASP